MMGGDFCGLGGFTDLQGSVSLDFLKEYLEFFYCHSYAWKTRGTHGVWILAIVSNNDDNLGCEF